MASDLHTFLTGQFAVKLREDVALFRVFNRADLAHAAYFHVRRHLLIQPGWMCRAEMSTSEGPADLALYRQDRFQALLRLECLLKPGLDNFFPADMLGHEMEKLRRSLAVFEKAELGRGYLFGVFDTSDSWFYPSGGDELARSSAPDFHQAMWAKQSCFWVPFNCRELPNYAEWRKKWDALAAG